MALTKADKIEQRAVLAANLAKDSSQELGSAPELLA
jgi:hypothetical protein